MSGNEVFVLFPRGFRLAARVVMGGMNLLFRDTSNRATALEDVLARWPLSTARQTEASQPDRSREGQPMQVFLGITMPQLADAFAQGEFGPPPLPAYGALPMHQAAGGDTREPIVWTAIASAARASLRRLAADPEAPRRRVVVEARVSDTSVTENPVAGASSSVILVEALSVDDVVCVHTDEPDAADLVRNAVRSLREADAGDEKASSLVDDAIAPGLLPHRKEEIPTLLG